MKVHGGITVRTWVAAGLLFAGLCLVQARDGWTGECRLVEEQLTRAKWVNYVDYLLRAHWSAKKSWQTRFSTSYTRNYFRLFLESLMQTLLIQDVDRDIPFHTELLVSSQSCKVV